MIRDDSVKRFDAHLENGKLVIQDECQNRDRDQQELHSKRVLIPVISGLELDVHQVQGGIRGADENDLSCNEQTCVDDGCDRNS